MFKLLKYLKKYRVESILGPLFKLLEATLELFIPLLVAMIIDQGIREQAKGVIIQMSLLMAALGLIGLIFSVTAQFFAAKAAVGFVTRIREVLFEKIQDFTYGQLDRIGSSTLITRMTSDMNQVQSAMNLALRLLLRSPFVVFGAMIMAFTVDVKGGLVFAVTIPVLSVVVFGIMLACIPLYKKVQGALDRVLGKTRENLSGVRVIRAFCKEEEEVAEFDERNRLLTNAQNFVGRISALMNPLTYLIINLGIIVLIYVGALQVEGGHLTQGDVVALYNYMSMILVELVKLASLIISITKGVACGNRIQAVLEGESGETVYPTEELKVGDAENLVEFKDVSFKYPGAGENSLDHISFTLKAGETLGVIGGTGSGKSTLIQLIPRFYDAGEGTVFFKGKDVRGMDPAELTKVIGTVPQKAVLFKGTLRENLCWGNPEATDETLLAAIKTAQATDILKAKPEGLDAPVEQGGRNFSGGQRQRLTIARALAKEPELLILDDSASALDFATDAALRKALKELKNDPAVVIVSQRTSSIAHADQILVLDDGEAVGLGTHAELLETCPVYREIYDSQFKKEGKGNA